jgi:hypothetical protein
VFHKHKWYNSQNSIYCPLPLLGQLIEYTRLYKPDHSHIKNAMYESAFITEENVDGRSCAATSSFNGNHGWKPPPLDRLAVHICAVVQDSAQGGVAIVAYMCMYDIDA